MELYIQKLADEEGVLNHQLQLIDVVRKILPDKTTENLSDITLTSSSGSSVVILIKDKSFIIQWFVSDSLYNRVTNIYKKLYVDNPLSINIKISKRYVSPRHRNTGINQYEIDTKYTIEAKFLQIGRDQKQVR